MGNLEVKMVKTGSPNHLAVAVDGKIMIDGASGRPVFLTIREQAQVVISLQNWEKLRDVSQP